MSYAASIRALRSGRNWTQADLAKRIGGGITNQSVSGWERGISKPSRDNIFELSRIFGVPLEQFLPEDDKQNSSQPGQETASPARSALFSWRSRKPFAQRESVNLLRQKSPELSS